MKPDTEAPSTSLRGRPMALGVARAVWFVLVALALGLLLLSIPWQFAYFVNQIDPASLEQLRQAGLALNLYVGYNIALYAVGVLVSIIVAAVIFWRKSDDWMVLFASLALVLIALTGDSQALAPVGQHYPALLWLDPFLSLLGESQVI